MNSVKKKPQIHNKLKNVSKPNAIKIAKKFEQKEDQLLHTKKTFA